MNDDSSMIIIFMIGHTWSYMKQSGFSIHHSTAISPLESIVSETFSQSCSKADPYKVICSNRKYMSQ